MFQILVIFDGLRTGQHAANVSSMESMSIENPAWTDEDLERLQELYGIFPTHIVAEKMGRSLKSVQVQANRMGLSYHLTGMSSAEKLGEKHGLSTNFVKKLMACASQQPMETKGGQKYYDNFSAADVIELYKRSYTIEALAKHLGVSHEFMSKYVSAYRPLDWMQERLGRIDPETAARIEEDYKEYLQAPTAYQLAISMHISPKRMKAIVLGLGIEYQSDRRLPAHEVARIQEFVEGVRRNPIVTDPGIPNAPLNQLIVSKFLYTFKGGSVNDLASGFRITGAKGKDYRIQGREAWLWQRRRWLTLTNEFSIFPGDTWFLYATNDNMISRYFALHRDGDNLNIYQMKILNKGQE